MDKRRVPDRRAARLVAITFALLAPLGLAGCVAEPSASAPASPSPESSAPSPFTPVLPDEFTAAAVQSEAERLADALIATIDPGGVVHDDVYSQEVAETDGEGAYWGVLHTLTLDPAVDPAAAAESIALRLTEAGWVARDGTNEGGAYLIALSSSEAPATSWFVVVGADTTVPGQPVVTLQLASPPLR